MSAPRIEPAAGIDKVRVCARLEELGHEEVLRLLAIDGLPHAWRPAIREWIKEKADGNDQRGREARSGATGAGREDR